MTPRIIIADVMDGLAQLPSESVQACVTSPPYFNLRVYLDNIVRIDPKLDNDTRLWLENELVQRKIVHAR